MDSEKDKIDIRKLGKTAICFLADEYILHDRNKRIFLKRYIHGMTIQKIVDTEFEIEDEIISIDQTKRVLKKCMEIILEHVEIKDGSLRVAS